MQARLETPATWLGPDMAANPNRWTWVLSDDEIATLRQAAENFLTTGRDLAKLRADNFDLPAALCSKLLDLRNTLINGQGFSLLRGLPVADLTRAEAATIFYGIGAHLGHARSQNAKGHLLGHVTDLGADPNDPNARIYQTHARQSFHTDSADVVGLLCLRDAKDGGDSLLVSAEAIWNAMYEARPELALLLCDEISTDRRGEVPEGAEPFFNIPVFNWFAGKLSGIYQRQYIDSAQRFPDAVRLTARHVEALDLFDTLANDPALNFRMRLSPGDMQFVYNHALLHDRTGFTDHADPDMRRHLLRLWLAIPGDRALPPAFAARYGRIEVGNRGGVDVPGERLIAPLSPV